MAASSSSNAEMEAAEKLYRLAEERFLAGDVPGALRTAREAQAQARSRALPAQAAALAAYEVHHAAACHKNWYAVLGIARTPPSSPSPVTHEAIKQRYRRLCLALHPDKNRSAAAEGAFKLLQDAWAALSARHPPPPPPNTTSSSSSSSTGAGDEGGGGWRPREFRSVFCGRCGSEYRMPVDEDVEGFKCGLCRREASPPPKAMPPPPERSSREEKKKFSCPGQCPGCGAPYAESMVSKGTWLMGCTACRRSDRIHVKNAYSFWRMEQKPEKT